MTVQVVQSLVDAYASWLKDNFFLRQLDNGIVSVSTPFLDRHNDCIEIYVVPEGTGFLITDGGETLGDLESCGVDMKSQSRRSMLRGVVTGLGVFLTENDELSVRAAKSDFVVKKHLLIQSILTVGDLFFTSRPYVENVFLEEVQNWMEQADIRFTSNIKIAGRSGLDHHFHFVIPHSSKAPERLIKVINSPRKETAELMTFAWLDTRETRRSDSKAIAVLNDTERQVSAQVIEVFENYEIESMLWSRREEVRARLAV